MKPLLDELPSLPIAGQVALLDAIRRRGDPSVRAAVLKACDSAEGLVRVAALRALGVIGSADDVLRLARLAAVGSREESAAARLALANLPGREPSSAMLALRSDAQPSFRVELMKALAARSATEAAPALTNQLTDSDEPVRHAALEAIAVLGDEKQVPAIIAFLNRAQDEPARQAADNALEAIVGRARSKCLDPLVAGFKDAPPLSRVVLLEQLGRLGGSEALEIIRSALNDGKEPVRAAAFRALAGWPDAQALPDLLGLAQSEIVPGRRTLAFRGCVRLCRESEMSADERLACLSQTAGLAVSTEEKMLIISALGEVADAGSLELLVAYFEEAPLVDPASLAVVKVASALGPEHQKEAVAALEHVLKDCQNPEAQGQAKNLLKKLGAITP
jgi:HEAT repeat protein